MPYEISDRVQATRFYLMRQKHKDFRLKDETTVGVVQGYKAPQKGLAVMNVLWFTGKTYPDQYEQPMRADYIEPLGTKR
jgi:hypothetical protein